MLLQCFLGILGTSRLVTAGWGKKWGEEEAIGANDEKGDVLHCEPEEIGSLGTRVSSSLSKSAKGASMAGGWQKTTRLPGRKGRLRQMLRRRRLSRLRFTALPSLRRTTKIRPRGAECEGRASLFRTAPLPTLSLLDERSATPSRPQRIQRQWPLIQAIALKRPGACGLSSGGD